LGKILIRGPEGLFSGSWSHHAGSVVHWASSAGRAEVGPGLFFCFSIDLNNKEVNSDALLVDKSSERMSAATSSILESG
jgi:hypothetical protein